MHLLKSTVFVFFLAFTAPAATIDASARLCAVVTGDGYINCNDISPTYLGSEIRASSTNQYLGGSGGYYDATADAWASYGSIGASVDASMSNFELLPRANWMGLWAMGTLIDTFWASNAPLDGFLMFKFHIEGSVYNSSLYAMPAETYVSIARLTGTSSAQTEYYGDFTNRYGGTNTVDQYAYFGVPLTLTPTTLSISVTSWIWMSNPTDSPVHYTGTANADFGSTIALSEILITDADGNPIPGATITAESGNQYPLSPLNDAPSQVPEPASLGLVGAGLAAVSALISKHAR